MKNTGKSAEEREMEGPSVGDVIPFWYLWRREQEEGEDAGRKLRPCVVAIVAVTQDDGSTTVAVLPVTHTPPSDNYAVTIPQRIKRRLGLDSEPSWIICSELNRFIWPGFDIGRTPDGEAIYGRLPKALLEAARAKLLEAMRERRAKAVLRD